MFVKLRNLYPFVRISFSSFRINYESKSITFEEAVNLVYNPNNYLFYVSDKDPFKRVYNKKGFKIAKQVNDSP